VTFQHFQWVYLAVPLLLAFVVLRFRRRRFWGHSLVEHVVDELSEPNPLLRLPTVLEALAVGFLLLALLGPIYPFVLSRVERGGLEIMFVFDLSQSMLEPLGHVGAPNPTQAVGFSTPPKRDMPIGNESLTKMDAVKTSAAAFIRKRPGDAIGLVVFSNDAYLVSPATFDHDSLLDYLHMVSPLTLVTEGYTAIGEGLARAQQFLEFSQDRERRTKGQIIILFTDGVNNYGRDPIEQIEKASMDGIRIYYIGVALEPGTSQEIAQAVTSTGGQFFDVRDPRHLEEAVDAIDKIEKGRFYTLRLVQQQPAYFIFVLLAFLALAARMALNGIPHFVDLS
jgi:von Willebrand factor type A domain